MPNRLNEPLLYRCWFCESPMRLMWFQAPIVIVEEAKIGCHIAEPAWLIEAICDNPDCDWMEAI